MVSDSDGIPSMEIDVNPNKTSRKRKRKHGVVTAIRVTSISVSTQTEETNPVPVLIQQTKTPLWELDTTVDPPTWYKNQRLDLGVHTTRLDIPIVELMVNHFEVSGYKVGDYVLRMHPTTISGEGHPNKLSSFWQGPYLVQEVLQDNGSTNIYTIEHLVTGRRSKAHISHLKLFYYNPEQVQPFNIEVKDTDEYVVGDILDHKVDDSGDMRWRVRWDGYSEVGDTCERFQNLEHKDKFQLYYLQHSSLHHYLPEGLRPKRSTRTGRPPKKGKQQRHPCKT